MASASASHLRSVHGFHGGGPCCSSLLQRNPRTARLMIRQLEDDDPVSCFITVNQCQRVLMDAGLAVPPWDELAYTQPRREEEPQPSQPKTGWQQRASRKLEAKFLHDSVWPALDDSARALIRSQCGPLASAPLTALPTSKATMLDPQFFRLLLCRRLHLPLPLSMRTCRCGRQLDMFWPSSCSVCCGRGSGEEGVPS